MNAPNLRFLAVEDFVTVEQTAIGLAAISSTLSLNVPEAETIELSYQGENSDSLVAVFTASTTEQRDRIVFKLESGLIPGLKFGRLLTAGVERGHRRRLLVSAQIVGGV
jgi:hypothetical protein